jgi:gas vesicle protein
MTSENASGTPSDNAGGEDSSTRGTAGFVAGVLFGAFLGAAFALFLAPERGEKTRGRVSRRLKALREDALEGIDRAGARTRKELRRRQRRFEAELQRARDQADEALD